MATSKTYPKRDTHVAPPPPHHGWLASGKTYTKREIHDGVKVLRIRCEHKRRTTGRLAEAVLTPADTESGRQWVIAAERDAASAPCQFTRCPRWDARLRALEEEYRDEMNGVR